MRDDEVTERLEARRREVEASERSAIEAEVAAEREAAAKHEAARLEVAQARASAIELHAEAGRIGGELRDLLGHVVAKARRLEELGREVGRRRHVEAWHADNSPGVVQRVEIATQLEVPRLAATVCFKLGKALARVAGGQTPAGLSSGGGAAGSLQHMVQPPHGRSKSPGCQVSTVMVRLGQ